MVSFLIIYLLDYSCVDCSDSYWFLLGGKVESTSSRQCTLVLPKNALFSHNCLFSSPELPFCFLELPFRFPEKSFYFSEMPCCFPELPFSFPEVLSIYLLCLSFFKNAFFLADCTFSLSCSELPTYDAYLITVKPLHGVWFFMYFIQILASMIACKMQFLNL